MLIVLMHKRRGGNIVGECSLLYIAFFRQFRTQFSVFSLHSLILDQELWNGTLLTYSQTSQDKVKLRALTIMLMELQVSQ
jgi:hypothetical protein